MTLTEYLDLFTTQFNQHTTTEKLIRQFGHAFAINPNRPLNDGLEQLQLGECYNNALAAIAERPDLSYCEGIAITETLPIPLHHAWAVDQQGFVVDNTWQDGIEYYGVAFTREFMYELLDHKTTVAVFDGSNAFTRQLYRSGIPASAIRTFERSSK